MADAAPPRQVDLDADLAPPPLLRLALATLLIALLALAVLPARGGPGSAAPPRTTPLMLPALQAASRVASHPFGRPERTALGPFATLTTAAVPPAADTAGSTDDRH